MKSPPDAGEGDAKASLRSSREQRLAEALRANLKRRKARERQRAADEGAGEGAGNTKEPS